MHTLIVADDLSGAADCAAFFGAGAHVRFDGMSGEIEGDVVAIDAATRAESAQSAAHKVHALFARHAAPGITLFKKFDSTLRGHVGVEIRAALDALAPFDPVAIVCPAYPATGRIVREGRVYVHGQPLEKTEIWRRENPAGPADLGAMLTQAGLGATRALIRDAANEDELAAIVREGKGMGRTVLWAGSAGLARHLAPAAIRHALNFPPAEGAILFVVGSPSGISRQQAMNLAGEIPLTILPPAQIGSAPLPHHPGDALVMLGDGASAGDLLPALADRIAPLASKAGALFLTGGETARAVLTRLGVEGLVLLGEIAPGVALSRAVGGAIDAKPVVTKAGAFGAPDIMRRVRQVLQGGAVSLQWAP